jgi:hypothetical protein
MQLFIYVMHNRVMNKIPHGIAMFHSPKDTDKLTCAIFKSVEFKIMTDLLNKLKYKVNQ